MTAQDSNDEPDPDRRGTADDPGGAPTNPAGGQDPARQDRDEAATGGLRGLGDKIAQMFRKR